MKIKAISIEYPPGLISSSVDAFDLDEELEKLMPSQDAVIWGIKIWPIMDLILMEN